MHGHQAELGGGDGQDGPQVDRLHAPVFLGDDDQRHHADDRHREHRQVQGPLVVEIELRHAVQRHRQAHEGGGEDGVQGEDAKIQP